MRLNHHITPKVGAASKVQDMQFEAPSSAHMARSKAVKSVDNVQAVQAPQPEVVVTNALKQKSLMPPESLKEGTSDLRDKGLHSVAPREQLSSEKTAPTRGDAEPKVPHTAGANGSSVRPYETSKRVAASLSESHTVSREPLKARQADTTKSVSRTDVKQDIASHASVETEVKLGPADLRRQGTILQLQAQGIEKIETSLEALKDVTDQAVVPDLSLEARSELQNLAEGFVSEVDDTVASSRFHNRPLLGSVGNGTDASLVDRPSRDVPSTDAPLAEISSREAPSTDAPLAEISSREAPSTDAPLSMSSDDISVTVAHDFDTAGAPLVKDSDADLTTGLVEKTVANEALRDTEQVSVDATVAADVRVAHNVANTSKVEQETAPFKGQTDSVLEDAGLEDAGTFVPPVAVQDEIKNSPAVGLPKPFIKDVSAMRVETEGSTKNLETPSVDFEMRSEAKAPMSVIDTEIRDLSESVRRAKAVAVYNQEASRMEPSRATLAPVLEPSLEDQVKANPASSRSLNAVSVGETAELKASADVRGQHLGAKQDEGDIAAPVQKADLAPDLTGESHSREQHDGLASTQPLTEEALPKTAVSQQVPSSQEASHIQDEEPAQSLLAKSGAAPSQPPQHQVELSQVQQSQAQQEQTQLNQTQQPVPSAYQAEENDYHPTLQNAVEKPTEAPRQESDRQVVSEASDTVEMMEKASPDISLSLNTEGREPLSQPESGTSKMVLDTQAQPVESVAKVKATESAQNVQDVRVQDVRVQDVSDLNAARDNGPQLVSSELVSPDAKASLDVDAEVSLGVGAKASFDVDAKASLDVDAKVSRDVDAKVSLDVDAEASLDVDAKASLEVAQDHHAHKGLGFEEAQDGIPHQSVPLGGASSPPPSGAGTSVTLNAKQAQVTASPNFKVTDANAELPKSPLQTEQTHNLALKKSNDLDVPAQEGSVDLAKTQIQTQVPIQVQVQAPTSTQAGLSVEPAPDVAPEEFVSDAMALSSYDLGLEGMSLERPESAVQARERVVKALSNVKRALQTVDSAMSRIEVAGQHFILQVDQTALKSNPFKDGGGVPYKLSRGMVNGGQQEHGIGAIAVAVARATHEIPPELVSLAAK